MHTAELIKAAKTNKQGKVAEPAISFPPVDIVAGFRRRKNLLAMQDLATVRMKELVAANPDWGLKDVLAEVIKGYPKEIPGDVLLQMTNFMVAEWASEYELQEQAA